MRIDCQGSQGSQVRGVGRAAKAGTVILVIAVLSPATLHAQAPLPMTAMVAAKPDAAVVEPDAHAVRLLVGRSTLVDVGTSIARVSLTSADVADALVTAPNQLLVNGKIPGTISMFVWDRGGAIRRYEVIVQRDLARLAEQLSSCFPEKRSTYRATAETWSSRAACRARTWPRRPSTSPPVMSRRKMKW